MPINLVLGIIFFAIGLLLSYIGFILGSIDAFREDVAWGVIFWCIPYIGGILFYIKKWSNHKNRKSFFVVLAGWLVTSLGGGLLKQASSSFQTSTNSGADINYAQNPSTESPYPSSIEFNVSPSPTQASFPVYQPSSERSSVADRKDEFKQSMKLGYVYYAQRDYPTALIHFNKALEARSSDGYALKAVENTKSALAKPSKRIVQAKAK